MRNLLLFVLIVFVQVLMDPSYCACETQNGKLLLIVHHMINIGLFVGSFLFGYHTQHLIFLGFAIGLHILLGGCFLTKINNRLCNLQTNDHILITFTNHIMDFIGSNAHRQVYYILAFLAAMYDVFHIRKMAFCQ